MGRTTNASTELHPSTEAAGTGIWLDRPGQGWLVLETRHVAFVIGRAGLCIFRSPIQPCMSD
jgi:hypothetical protein